MALIVVGTRHGLRLKETVRGDRISAPEVIVSRLLLIFIHVHLCCCSVPFFVCVLRSWTRLATRFRIGVDLPKEEFLRCLHAVPETKMCLATLRDDLFNTAVVRGLADSEDILVRRRKGRGGGKSVREKHVEDIWIIVNAIRNLQLIPRVLLRNGKRSKSALTHSRERIKSTRTAPQEVDKQSSTTTRMNKLLTLQLDLTWQMKLRIM